MGILDSLVGQPPLESSPLDMEDKCQCRKPIQFLTPILADIVLKKGQKRTGNASTYKLRASLHTRHDGNIAMSQQAASRNEKRKSQPFFRPNNKLCHLHWHSCDFLAPRRQVAVSSGHFWQLRDLVWGWKYPTRHVVQGAKPSREKLPGPQNSSRKERKSFGKVSFFKATKLTATGPTSFGT